MKHLLGIASGRADRPATTRSPLARLSTLVASTFAVLVVGALSSFGEGPNTPGSGTTSGFGAGGGDDETVGTLPTYDGGPVLDVFRNARLTRPSLYVQGRVDEVLSGVLTVRGDNDVLAQAMPGGELRLVFLGDAEVGFDRHSFHAANLRVGVTVPDGAPVLRSAAAWNGHAIGSWTYVYELPIAQFEANGLLDQAPVLAGVVTTQGATSVRAGANTDLVLLRQRR